MFDIYKRTLSILLWGISLVNIVKLTSNESYGMSDAAYFIFITILIITLIIIFIKKKNFLKSCKPNYVGVIFIMILIYLIIKSIILQEVVVNLSLLLFTICSMILLIISTFFELQD